MQTPTSARSSRHWFHFSAPSTFYPLAGRAIPWFSALALVLALAGLWIGFAIAPSDAQQGDGYRIIYLHVPTSWMAMFIYVVMAFWSVIHLVWKTRLSALMAQALAPTGAWMALMSLLTGSLWGKPMWGTWWVWDARLTSMLLLFFLYLGFIALTRSIDDPDRADQAGSILSLVGVFNVPVIYFSVYWWNTLHQGASVSSRGSSMASVMLLAMLLMGLAAWMYAIAMTLRRVRVLILQREANTRWVQELTEVAAKES
ncbi:cytochrome c biogenesis protein CcsA [Chitinibacter bivalviorum]|uniref:Heme exporter protein C n=1 Tax=Chitinibacter bivalviorum TaxID=2739434 RepID=A0A7H9BGB4_9NEIS|nr:heme ABC transporter permease CcmC [Chitinibacter bivalviorum]QLG87760.1 cytochrome c biogenesis protein CcsA [Chitinibacter bivalviorum]